MDPKTYHSIRARLDFRKRDRFWVRQLLVDATLVSASLYACTHPFHPVTYVLAQATLAVVFFRCFSLMHDAVHGCVSSNRWVNDTVGFLAGAGCFMPFQSWKYLHLEHHLWAGNVQQDPSAKLREDFDPNKKAKYRILTAIWRSWVPLLGFLQEVVFWVYASTQLRNPKYRWKVKFEILFSATVPWILYFAMAQNWPELFNLKNFAPAFFLYLMMVELINFPHHMDVPAFRGTDRLRIQDQYLVTRSSYYPDWFSRGFLLNFNLHTEHHLYPDLPWHQLNRARSLVKPALGAKYNESLGNAWIVKNRRLRLETLLPVGPNGIPPGVAISGKAATAEKRAA